MVSEIDIDGDGEATGEGAAAGQGTEGDSAAESVSIACRSCGNPVAGPFFPFAGKRMMTLDAVHLCWRRNSCAIRLGLIAHVANIGTVGDCAGNGSEQLCPWQAFQVYAAGAPVSGGQLYFLLTLSLTQTLFLAFDLSFDREDAPPTEVVEGLEGLRRPPMQPSMTRCSGSTNGWAS